MVGCPHLLTYRVNGGTLTLGFGVDVLLFGSASICLGAGWADTIIVLLPSQLPLSCQNLYGLFNVKFGNL